MPKPKGSPGAKKALKEAIGLLKRGRVDFAKIAKMSRQATYEWDVCPAEAVLGLEKATGVSRHRLRPDIYPAT